MASTKELGRIPEFYAGKKVFVTGSTGFIGKVLVEKLLRSCPDVAAVYILVRPKKGCSVLDRVKDILSQKIFDELRSENPSFSEKIIPVDGDIMMPSMGISEADADMLRNEVSIVFHSAATVRFDEPLRLAIEMNVVAIRKMLNLCRTFKKLSAFVHVSTAYANCDKQYIEEIIYPVPVDTNKLIDVVTFLDDESLRQITPRLIGAMPNTYTFTKQLGEQLLAVEGQGLPLAIVRPSIVGASWKEPLPGWIDNFNGPSGLYVAAGKGLLRTMKGEQSALADIVPVDLPVNTMIAVAWHTTVNWESAGASLQPMVYNCTTSTLNPFTWGEMESITQQFFARMPFEKCFRRPRISVFTSNSLVHDYWVFFSHLVPAYLTDFVQRMVGQKPRMVKLYSKLHKTMDVLNYFTSNSWEWTYGNTDALTRDLHPEDRKTFYMDPRGLHWPTYIENYCLGTKLYVMNEDLSGLPAARAHLRRLRNVRYTFNTILVIVLWRTLIARSEIARNVWHLILALVFKFVRNLRLTSTLRS